MWWRAKCNPTTRWNNKREDIFSSFIFFLLFLLQIHFTQHTQHWRKLHDHARQRRWWRDWKLGNTDVVTASEKKTRRRDWLVWRLYLFHGQKSLALLLLLLYFLHVGRFFWLYLLCMSRYSRRTSAAGPATFFFLNDWRGYPCGTDSSSRRVSRLLPRPWVLAENSWKNLGDAHVLLSKKPAGV